MQLVLRRRFSSVHLHTAQQRLHLHQKNGRAKGLGEIIVAALTDAHDVVQLAVFGRKQDDGNIGNSAKLPAHGKAVRAGHHDIQYHQLRRLLTECLQQRVTAFNSRRLRGSYGAVPVCSFHRPPNRWNVPCVLLESSAKCCAWAQHRHRI